MEIIQEYLDYYDGLRWYTRSKDDPTLQRIDVMASPPIVKGHHYAHQGEPDHTDLRPDDVHEQLFRFETEGREQFRRDVAEELGHGHPDPDERPDLILVTGGPPGQGVKRHSDRYLNSRIQERLKGLTGQTHRVERLTDEQAEQAAAESPYFQMIEKRLREVEAIREDPARSLEDEGRVIRRPGEEADERREDEKLITLVKKARVRERYGIELKSTLTEIERRRAERLLSPEYHGTIHKLEARNPGPS